MLKLVQAASASHLDEVHRLFLEYADWLAIDLCFQDFEAEVAGLPGNYAPPEGSLILAIVDGRAAGCVGLRKLFEDVCEMKRLYVRSAFRGKGIGKALTTAMIEEARRIGYRRIRLDTLPLQMKEAAGMYRSLGFREIEPYCYNPLEGAVFMELAL